MSKDLTKKAVEMLLKGATLLGDPCPYCKGVRVMKDGIPLCVNCGKEPETNLIEEIPKIESAETKVPETPISLLEKKLEKLTRELDLEKNHEKQQEILKSINSLVEVIEKLKK